MPRQRESLGPTVPGGTSTFAVQPRQHAAAAEAAVRVPVTHNDAERRLLSPAADDIRREAGAEYPFTSPSPYEARTGIFNCAGWALALSSAATKYDSGTGWPGFGVKPPHAVGISSDHRLGIARTEILYSRCGGYLGHAVLDGPPPSGRTYCINSVSLKRTTEVT
jgi:peptide-methionine (R)-S-oxide reductase